MRILVLSQYYAPEPIPKPHELAVGLAERGHQVVSITTFPNYPFGSLYADYPLRPWRWETMDGVRVLRLPIIPDHSRSSIRRILNYSSFMAATSVLGPLGSGPIDVMYVWHPPLTIGLSAWIIGLMRHSPFVYGVHDIWPEAAVATGMIRSRTIVKVLSRLEGFVYRRASAIGVVSPGFKRNLMGKGVPPDKVHVLTDWANEDIYRPVPPDAALAEETGMAGRFNVLFGGNIGLAQALDTVIETAQRLSHIPDIQFVFVGGGVDVARLEALTREKGLANVRFLGRQPAEKMPYLYALADVLLAHFKRDPLFEISVPGKVFAYLACQRPVLMASEGDAADLVKAAGAGLACGAEDPDALARAVLEFYRMSPESRAELGVAGRRAFLQQYSRNVLVQRHEELLLQVATGGPRAVEQANRV